MLELEELKKYSFPEKINFGREEERLRLLNVSQTKDLLYLLEQYPHMLEDYETLKAREFKKKYVKLTSDDKIYDKCKNFYTKVENYAKCFNINKKFLVEKLKREDLLCNNFIVDFKRQNPYEIFVENYFQYLDKDLGLLQEFKHLPVSGPTALYVYSGIITDDKIKKSVGNLPSSVDFVWKYSFRGREVMFYATHKYTNGTGTAQKNQMRELEKFLENARQYAGGDKVFIAIMDGNYYSDYPYPNFKSKPKPSVFQHIKDRMETSTCKVATSYSFTAVLIGVLKSWLCNTFKIEDVADEIEKLDYVLEKTNFSI